MITGAMRTTLIEILEMFLDLPTLGMVVESAALTAAAPTKGPITPTEYLAELLLRGGKCLHLY